MTNDCLSSDSRFPRPARHATGFTLVELLVVIGIIALLISILMPALGKAREQGNAIKCTANLRSIVTGVVMFSQERKHLPGPIYAGVRSPAANPPISYLSSDELLPPFLNGNIEVWHCPSNDAVRLNGQNNGQLVFKVNNQISTTPQYFFGSMTSTHTTEQKRPKQLTQVRSAGGGSTSSAAQRVYTSPTDIWMLCDIDGYNYPTSDAALYGLDVPTPFPYPHAKGRNYGFFDSHVEYRRADDLPPNP
jgi:prepilin-type N-terminal cleavage/methylation domain-containing protein/prepilin-type processing-associated H-X9-DG protein